MEMAQESGISQPGMTRTSSKDSLRVSAQTDVRKLKGALQGRLLESGACKLEAIGMRAVGVALKAIAIIGTPPATATRRFNLKTTVNSRRILIDNDAERKQLNMTIVSFDVESAKDGEGTEINMEGDSQSEPIRVSRATAVSSLAIKISKEFEADNNRKVVIRVMGPMATNVAMRALCVAKTIMSTSGIENPAQFQAKFVKENELSIVEVVVSLDKGGD
eukprot:CAMPEP_0170176064 /NCGR_PEP_ID=MMETSP0040_2-20121228/9025_1 /TAXON_ID=641309 /ORGANISM="Lotharella oceanica, Strain CCMP622" /LENGTH=218 /DNA_ID=CAMNT_0010418267 /DNA_START=160 /DNA_END=816 /DNA_ORIENTATION=+